MIIVFIGYYSIENYKVLLECADDRSAIDDRWEDWLVNFIKAKTDLVRNFKVEEVHLDVKKMNDYFKSNKLKNTAETRSNYISEMGAKEYESKINN